MAKSIEALADHFEANGHPDEANLLRAQAVIFRKALIPDEFPNNATQPKKTTPAEIRPLQTPEAITNFWQTKLQIDGKRIGLDIKVPGCDWTEEEIRKPMIDIKGKEVPSMLVYLPQELTGKEGLVKLGQMYPRMNSWFVQEGTTVQDSPDANKKGGWFKVEATVDAPNCDTAKKDLKNYTKDKRYSPQTLNTYILASQASKDLTGHYLDERSTWSRLLGSRSEGDVLDANFGSGGFLHVVWDLYPRHRSSGLGGRFGEVKKT